jgi:hypothetical protein
MSTDPSEKAIIWRPPTVTAAELPSSSVRLAFFLLVNLAQLHRG